MLAGEVESGDASVLYVNVLLCLLQSALGIRVYLSICFFFVIYSHTLYTIVMIGMLVITSLRKCVIYMIYLRFNRYNIEKWV